MCSIEYDAEVSALPKHLDISFFEEVLDTALRTSKAKVLSIHIKMGSNTGENYCSQIYRTKISFQLPGKPVQTMMFIVKSIPRLESVEFIEDLQVYLKEKVTYYDVLPRLELLMKCKQRFGPKLYHCIKQPESTMVFEDLGHLGYVMASRELGLDEEHCRLVMERLGEFHATSMALAELDPHIFEAYSDGMLSPQGLAKGDGLLMSFFSGNGQELLNLVNTWPGFERIAGKIAKYLQNHRANLERSQAPQDKEIRVLNHGDLWVNNMMFKYDGNKRPQDLVLIDFQMSVWGSPGIDLNYFFYTSLNLEVLRHKRPQLLHVYHSRLAETLRNLEVNVPVPSYEQILEEVHRREAYGFFANYGIFPTISQDKSQTADNNLESFKDADFAKQKLRQMFSSRRLADTLQYTLPHFERAGVLG
ncbi:uncharacterized protein Dana_GF15396 [Drosophila ananassae]|uniref:CHK kinase-like domain-containing protein n=1 Tax=Drosophila ananassae TaxID=7217 RepID=B3MKF9_DROAN|nr:uncharacterized protein LOC6498205 [Drosophila ananassae]EDV31512.1 uncharacterized protein Dana_GF15396 [Drosophila ananassae]